MNLVVARAELAEEKRDELLAACKVFVDQVIETADGNIVFGYQALDRLRAAIARAEEGLL